MSTLDQIRASIEARLTELKAEITALQAARAALHGTGRSRPTPTVVSDGAAKPRRRRAPRPASNGDRITEGTKTVNGAGGHAPAAANDVPVQSVEPAIKPRRRARAKPSKSEKPVEVLLAGQLTAMLGQAEEGLSAIAIAKRSNAGYDQVLVLLRHLESDGQVRRTGSRRTSLWRLITDQERIAERAAELESRSNAKAESPPDVG